jgi:uncharacterized protein (TIGR00725 family)
VRIISVIGASVADAFYCGAAYRVGFLAAEKGFVILTGGRTGVMEHAGKGAKDAGGISVGVLPSYDREDANRYCDIVIPTGLGHARNTVVVSAGELVVSIGGEMGTASEIAIALKLGRKVISLNSPLAHEACFHDSESFFGHFIYCLENL